jgi:hypothetical protein
MSEVYAPSEKSIETLTSQLMAYLHGYCTVDVNLRQLEQQMDFRWSPALSTDGQQYDHLLSMRLQNIVARSFHHWLDELSHAVSGLPGLHFSQKSVAVDADCKRAIRCILSELVYEFPRVKMNSSEIYRRVARASEPLLKRATAAARLVEMDALSAIEDIHRMCIAYLVNGVEAARPLVSALRLDAIHRGCYFHKLMGPAMEILEDIAATRPLPNARGGACMPPSGAVREESVLMWISLWGPFAVDCATEALKKPLAADVVDFSYSPETDVWVEPTSAIGLSPAVKVQPFPHPSHSTPSQDVLCMRARSSTSTGGGIRVARLVSVVLQALKMEIVDSQNVKGMVLMGLLLRCQCQQSIQQSVCGALVNSVRAESKPLDAVSNETCLDFSQFGDLRVFPRKMQMQITIALVAVNMALGSAETSNFVSLQDVARYAKDRLTHFKNTPQNAVSQIVSHLLRRFVGHVQLFANASASSICTQDIAYHASERHGERRRGICATETGKRHAAAYVRGLLDCALESGPRVAEQKWCLPVLVPDASATVGSHEKKK